MKKEIFIAICDRLNSEVPELRWIDADEGQADMQERLPVAFPCCLVDMAYQNCNTLAKNVQRVTISMRLTVIFEAGGRTSVNTPNEVRVSALSRLDVLDKIHRSLQYWSSDRLFMPMSRQSCVPAKRTDGLKVYNMVYAMDYIDTCD